VAICLAASSIGKIAAIAAPIAHGTVFAGLASERALRVMSRQAIDTPRWAG
jgi:hypothetical protein